MEKYKSETPPEFNLDAIQVPIALYNSKGDILSTGEVRLSFIFSF